MKILYLSHADGNFGAPKSMIKMIELLREYGIEPVVVTGKRNEINTQCDLVGIQNYSVRFVNIGHFSKDNWFVTLIKKHLYKPINFLAFFKLKKIMENESPNLIHTNTAVIDFGWKLSKIYSVPHVWHLREILNYHNGWKYYKKAEFEEYNKYTNKFIAISNAVQSHWLTNGLSKNKIAVIYNGVDAISNDINKISKNSKFHGVLVGGIYPSKGQEEVIRSLSLLTDEYKKKIIIDFIGTGNQSYIQSLKKLAENLNVEMCVRFRGYIENAAEYLSEYDFGIMSSKSEAFGRTTVEYMLNKILVIASNSGANEELIDHGITGLIYDIDEPESLKNQIMCVLTGDFSIDKVTQAAHRRAIEEFNSEKNAKNVLQVYKELIKEFD